MLQSILQTDPLMTNLRMTHLTQSTAMRIRKYVMKNRGKRTIGELSPRSADSEPNSSDREFIADDSDDED